MTPILKTLLFFFLISLPSFPGQPDPVAIQPFQANPSPPATIPAFPEQSDVAGCQLDLPEPFFHGVKSACGGELQRGRCCPVLATWLYSAYASTALGQAAKGRTTGGAPHNTTSYDMPLLPDDSETCVADVDKALRGKGIELKRPNETCDVVYCYCGIRLHPLSCPEAFSVSQEEGKVVGDKRVRRLERDCLTRTGNVNGFPGLGGCSKCLNTLHQLNNKNNNSNNKALNTSKSDDRTTKMHNKDCELMGLTWLLAKNRTAYMHTVSAVIRAIMMNTDDSDHPRSCTLSSDGMPLAVDSAEISDQSSSSVLGAAHISLCIALISLLYIMHFFAWSFQN